ncbi:MAG: hypothetical protein RH917_06885 [Lacipirellulaceae bacterium]
MDQSRQAGSDHGGRVNSGRQDRDFDIFLASEHDPEPQPEPGDFWIENPTCEDDGWDEAA